MKRKSRFLFLIVLLLLQSFVLAQETKIPGNDFKNPQIGILDVMSEFYDPATTRVLTDFLNTELFKVKLFKIVERGVIEKILNEQKFSASGLIKDSDILKIGQLLAVEKLFVTSVGKFAKTTTLNIRIIDVSTSLIDFTENVFIKEEDLIFDSIKEVIGKIALHYSIKNEDTGDMTEINQKKWAFLGANEEETAELINLEKNPDEYLDVRQYDISFKISDYLKIMRGGWDAADIKQFLIANIPYPMIEKALSFGIVDLNNYNTQFRPNNIKFEEYLDAYANHIVSAEEYLVFKEGYRRDRLVLGIGGVADNIPIANAEFRFILGQIGWEHYWTKYQRNFYKVSSQAGIHLMQGIIPVPFFETGIYLGSFPFYFKFGAGVLAEVLLGGHYGLFLRPGFEVFEKFEFDLTLAWGTQPNVDYSGDGIRIGEPGFAAIKFPYIAVEFMYKL